MNTADQILAWKFYSSSSWAIFLGILTIATIFLFRWGLKNTKENRESFWWPLISFLSVICFFIFAFNVVFHTNEAIKVKIAPDAVLWEAVQFAR